MRHRKLFLLCALLCLLAATVVAPLEARSQSPAVEGSHGGGGGGDDGGGSGGGNGGEDGPLKLRLNDSIGKPGGVVALVVRTYAARPLRQGHITVRVRRPTTKALGLTTEDLTQPARPLTFLKCIVFSVRGDATSRSTTSNAADSQSVGIDFASATAGVNAADGPLAVIFMKLDPGVAPGSRYLIEIDPAATGLTDAAGAAVATTPIQGTLTVRAASSPYALEAEGDDVSPGATAELGVETREPFAVYAGRITLRWSPSIQRAAPSVVMDPRYGKGKLVVERSEPGLLTVSFSSPAGLINSVPGRILGVSLPTSAASVIGTSVALTVDPKASYLLDKKNRKLPLRIENGSLAFR